MTLMFPSLSFGSLLQSHTSICSSLPIYSGCCFTCFLPKWTLNQVLETDVQNLLFIAFETWICIKGCLFCLHFLKRNAYNVYLQFVCYKTAAFFIRQAEFKNEVISDILFLFSFFMSLAGRITEELAIKLTTSTTITEGGSHGSSTTASLNGTMDGGSDSSPEAPGRSSVSSSLRCWLQIFTVFLYSHIFINTHCVLFSGDIEDPCAANPCSQGSTCESRANQSFVCLCLAGDYYSPETKGCGNGKCYYFLLAISWTHDTAGSKYNHKYLIGSRQYSYLFMEQIWDYYQSSHLTWKHTFSPTLSHCCAVIKKNQWYTHLS